MHIQTIHINIQTIHMNIQTIYINIQTIHMNISLLPTSQFNASFLVPVCARTNASRAFVGQGRAHIRTSARKATVGQGRAHIGTSARKALVGQRRAPNGTSAHWWDSARHVLGLVIDEGHVCERKILKIIGLIQDKAMYNNIFKYWQFPQRSPTPPPPLSTTTPSLTE